MLTKIIPKSYNKFLNQIRLVNSISIIYNNIPIYKSITNQKLNSQSINNIKYNNLDNQQQQQKRCFTSKTSIEEIYQKKTPTEHVLLRPDSYIGTIQKIEHEHWVLKQSMFNKRKKEVIIPSQQQPQINKPVSIHPENVKYIPGLLKIFDEILVNAADNYQRDKSMSFIKVDIDPNQDSISITNDGKGIPIVMHKTENCYVVEMVMGNLMSGSNFNDSELKVVGGRNGFGAKLTNIFSKEFSVETVDKLNKKKYSQKWFNNMSIREEPIISKMLLNEKDFTKITFKPDLEKFHIKSLWDDDILYLMERRVYDIAGCNPNLKVYLNGKELNYNFQSYVSLYEPYLKGDNKKKLEETSEEESNILYCELGDRWKIGIGLSDSIGQQFTQVSFVNSINTIKGGTHVNVVSDQVVRYISERLKKKHSDLDVRPMNIKNHLSLFVSCLIDNPSFDSQTKETLTTKPQLFGSTPEIPEQVLSQFVKQSKIIEKIAGWILMKQKAELVQQTSSRQSKNTLIKSILKLDDANWAGGPKSKECTLILTEGDSAKSLALSGLSVLGRNKYGVFPLRGKLLNVREASPKSLLNNEEINHLTTILGLSHKKDYKDAESLSELRYGKVMIMTDQDHDGSHIKGLIINFLHYFWPELLKKDFIEEFVTPLIKVSSGGKEKKSFFTMNDYLDWKKSLTSSQSQKSYQTKYYKGLGTSTSAEAKEYFSNLNKHVIAFQWKGENIDQLMDTAFSKGSIQKRQQWIKEADLTQSIDHTKQMITYDEFINKELVHYSWAANIRSIPSIVDGLKPGQRKILYACFKRRLHQEVKVAQLSGYVAEHTAYHHGEQSLNSTIVKMAHSFVGSNNIPLLYQGGQFGTRLLGGEDSASARYIFTKLEPLSRQIFNELDDPLLNYLQEEGESIQPDYYVPIIPMVLVNGAEGIGVGMATSVPLYSPVDLIDQLLCKLNNQPPLKKLIPWYKGFKGTIVKQPDRDTYKTSGCIQFSDDNKSLIISELPIGRWISDYKETLHDLMDRDLIKSFQESNSENTVHFTISLSMEQLEEMQDLTPNELLNLFKLTTLIHPNLTLFDENGNSIRYQSVEDIIDHFYSIRLEFYQKRKSHTVQTLNVQIEKLEKTIQFLQIISSGKLKLHGRTKQDLIRDLEENHQFTTNDQTMSYLFSLPILDITIEKIENLQSQLTKKHSEYNYISQAAIEDLWKSDLDQLRSTLLTIDDGYSRERKSNRTKSGQSESTSNITKSKKKLSSKNKK
ncbi:DNA topoisomerase II [Tieghemostelium lacteum]|uniref:DNA topoisomerase 2 n=1 Tax=Tieghemostelium lacteum TaxID=361077 RepID=A0A151ZIS7_TIELA|nr:DNA topoisomerase II [Tieghemostelium lacteum]|eukprot:KYQ93901.1 DNA topoisomerase II [Tieghemostelium lacteum]